MHNRNKHGVKLLAILSAAAIILGCGPTRSLAGNAGALNGAWVPVQQELNGSALPGAAYEGYILKIADTTYSYTDHDKGAIYYKDGKMDIYGRQGVNAGKHFTAIYKKENGQLLICYNLAGTGYPAAFDTKKGVGLFLSVFKQQ